MRGEVHVFLEKDGQRKEVQVEKRVGKGKPGFWFVEDPQPPQDQEGREDQPTPEEESPAMDEVRPVEVQAERAMWVSERITVLQNENEELKKAVQETKAKIELRQNTIAALVARFAVLESAIAEIAGHVQHQNVFNQSAKKSIDEVVEEVKAHQKCFQEVEKVLQNHEQHITNNGAVAQQMAQYIDALIKENENKSLWIATLRNEAVAQAHVLQQHQMGQEAIAGVLKMFMNQPPQHTTSGKGPAVTEVEDESQTGQDFQNGRSPHTRPPDGGSWTVVPGTIQVPDRMEMVGTQF